MSSRPARRLGVLTATLLVTIGLLAPVAVSADPAGRAATFGERGSVLADGPEVRAASTTPVVVRDLSEACPPGRVPRAGFRDVPSNFTFAPAIDCLVWYGITQGRTATTYAPGDRVTRQQMAVFLHRMLDDLVWLPEPPARSAFRDVPATGEAGRAINVLAGDELAELLGRRIVTGRTATSFDPQGRVTRAQMGSFIARTLEGVFEATGVTIVDRGSCRGVFRDESSIPAAHAANVDLLCAAGIVTGRADGTYGPDAPVTRAQMAAFLMRLMDVFVEARVTVPPDAFAEVHVDRGTGATACSDAGRDGSPGRPFCTIQSGIARARSIDGFVVDVVVRGRVQQYAESVVLSSGAAFEVNLAPADEMSVGVLGSVRIDGSDPADSNLVLGFDVISPSATPAVTVRTPGTALLVDTSVEGSAAAVAVDQTGRTGIIASTISGDDVGIDLVRTVLDADGSGTLVFDNVFNLSSGSYVRGPVAGDAQVTRANLEFWRDENEFPARRAVLGTDGGRPALVPAP
jgi:hypothetical protein